MSEASKKLERNIGLLSTAIKKHDTQLRQQWKEIESLKKVTDEQNKRIDLLTKNWKRKFTTLNIFSDNHNPHS